MDSDDFDAFARSLTTASSRRALVGPALGAALAGVLGVGPVAAKKGKNKDKRRGCRRVRLRECTLCRRGQIRSQPEGTPCTIGTCQNGSCIPPPPPATCTDGRKNGSETDVDCGGTCPRCATGKTCSTRNDCASALCAGTCQQCVNAGDCGTDTNGEMCACRDHESGQRFCTKLNAPPGRVFPAGTACTVCQGGEQCFPINGGAGGIECIRPCGA